MPEPRPIRPVQATATIDPSALNDLPDALRDGVVTAYADALAPVFWYLVPFIAVAFVLALFLKEIPLSDVAGLVARGEAIGGEEAERLEAEQRAGGFGCTPATPVRATAPAPRQPTRTKSASADADADARTTCRPADLGGAGLLSTSPWTRNATATPSSSTDDVISSARSLTAASAFPIAIPSATTSNISRSLTLSPIATVSAMLSPSSSTSRTTADPLLIPASVTSPPASPR